MTTHAGWTAACGACPVSLPAPLLDAQSGKLTLKNISFECDMSNRMLAIVGPVGAGKVRPTLHLLHAPLCLQLQLTHNCTEPSLQATSPPPPLPPSSPPSSTVCWVSWSPYAERCPLWATWAMLRRSRGCSLGL